MAACLASQGCPQPHDTPDILACRIVPRRSGIETPCRLGRVRPPAALEGAPSQTARAGADGKSATAATPRRGFAPRFHMPLGHGPEELCNTAAAPRTRGRRGTPLPTTARPRHGATRVPLPRPQSWADEDGPCSTATASRPRNESYLPRPAPAAGVDGTGPPGAPSPCMADLTPNLMVLPRRPSVPRSGLSPL